MESPIYCINLKERMDRKKCAEKEFKKINIQVDDVIFLDFYRHKQGGRYGCYDSHIKVWNDFYINHPDKEMCIIFEDDFKVTKNSNFYLKEAISFIKRNKDKVDILFLHNKFIEPYNYTYKTDNVNSTTNKYFINGYGFLAHAYIITRKYIKSVMNINYNTLPKPNGIDIDFDINMNINSSIYSENIYYCKYPIFIHNDHYDTNNDNNIIEKMLRLTFGENKIINLKIHGLKLLQMIYKNNNYEKKTVVNILKTINK
jgi:GR25 family glycosyltransferase involved in LPS biosynthesis